MHTKWKKISSNRCYIFHPGANLPSPGPDLIIEPAGQDDISSPAAAYLAQLELRSILSRESH